MATITIRNIPDDVYAELKVLAKLHRRSINNEVIYYIERATKHRTLDVEEKLALARRVRDFTAGVTLTDEEIEVAINSGRP